MAKVTWLLTEVEHMYVGLNFSSVCSTILYAVVNLLFKRGKRDIYIQTYETKRLCCQHYSINSSISLDEKHFGSTQGTNNIDG